MKLSTLVIIAGITVFVAWKTFHHPAFPIDANEYLVSYSAKSSLDIVSTPQPCKDRDYCVYVYFAPWCPSCRATMPLISTLRSAWKSTYRPGLKIVIGNARDGNKESLNEMAANIGPPVYLDRQDKFLWAVHVKYFPYFIVEDAHQNIIASGQDARHWVENEIKKHGGG